MTNRIKKTILACLISILLVVGGMLLHFDGIFVNATADDELRTYYIEGSTDSIIGHTSVDGAFESAPNLQGLKVTLMEKDKLIIRQVIDLKQMSKNDSIVKISVAPKTLGSGEFFTLKVDVVDVYDSNNYFTVQLKPYNGATDNTHAGYYLTRASNGQAFTAKDRSNNTIHVNQWGCWTQWNFGANKDRTKLEPEEQYLSFGYDVRENATYAHCTKGAGIKLLADYNDPLYYNNDLWKGFTTGEVYLRVYCEEYVSSQANLVVQQYGDVDLTKTRVEDTVGPKITIDYVDYNDYTLPDAVVDKTYSLPMATGFDTYSGEIDVDVNVYRNYYSSNKISVPINKRTNTFVPAVEGSYTVEYSAKDSQGKKTVKVLEINSVVATEPMEFDFGEYQSQVTVGELFTLPKYQVKGGSGNKQVIISVSNENVNLEIKNGMVRTCNTGKLTLLYTAIDYLGQEKTSIVKVDVVETDKPTFIEKPILPNTLIDGNRYILPVINAYNYISASGEEVPTVITAKTASGKDAGSVNGNVFIPSVQNDGEIVTIAYTATIGNESQTLTYQIPVVKIRNENGLDMTKMFRTSENCSVDANSEIISYYTTAKNATVEFISPISVIDFSAEWYMNSKSVNMNKFSLIFTDYADANNVVKFTYDKAGYVYLNDNFETRVAMNVSFADNTRMGLKYNDNNFGFSYNVSGNNVLVADKNTAGETFKGFSDHTYYVTFVMEEVSDQAGFSFGIICGHYFSSETTEWAAPIISIDGVYGGSFSINTVYTLADAFAFDIIDGKTDLYITITGPDDNAVYDVDGNLLKNYLVDDEKISLKLEKYGIYYVKYTSSDNQYNDNPKTYAINVIDQDAPEITLTGTVEKECKVGNFVNLPGFKMTDNYDEKAVCRVYVVTPTGEMITIKSTDKGFKASLTGKYVVVYTASDAEGNCNILIKEIIVKGK